MIYEADPLMRIVFSTIVKLTASKDTST